MPKTRNQEAGEIAESFVAKLKQENRQTSRNGKHVQEKQYDKLRRLLQKEIVGLSRYQATR